MWGQIGEGAAALIPSVALLGLFILAIRAIILADRRERAKRVEEDREIYGNTEGEAPPKGD